MDVGSLSHRLFHRATCHVVAVPQKPNDNRIVKSPDFASVETASAQPAVGVQVVSGPVGVAIAWTRH
jgi:hypothetical protein